MIGLTSRCIAVNTFCFATVNESHFPLNNKIKTHLATPWQTKALMRHFYMDANYCCVSPSFIHERGLLCVGAFLPAPSRCSFPRQERCHPSSDGETDVPGKQHAPLAPRQVQFKSTELCISRADTITERLVRPGYLHFLSDEPKSTDQLWITAFS